MRLITSLLAVVALMAAGSASALTSVNYSTSDDLSALVAGDTFTVDVNLSWDGDGSLQGVFASTTFDDSVIGFVGADWFGLGEFAASVFDVFPPPAFLPGLSRLGGAKQPGDPDSVLRTVQYGGAAPANANGATTALITTLTFQALGAGNTSISTIIANGDAGAVGDTFDGGNSLAVTVVPEPGTALLMGLGLAGLAAAGRRE